MKRFLVIGICLAFMTGCTAQNTFETLGNVDKVSTDIQPWEICLDRPNELTAAASQNDGTGQLYMCDDYIVMTQILESGDLNHTFKTNTGFDLESLQIIETSQDNAARYDSVWTCVSETGDQLGRIAVLDDGYYHYVLTTVANAENAGELSETWQTMFRSFRIEEPGSIVNSGS